MRIRVSIVSALAAGAAVAGVMTVFAPSGSGAAPAAPAVAAATTAVTPSKAYLCAIGSSGPVSSGSGLALGDNPFDPAVTSGATCSATAGGEAAGTSATAEVGLVSTDTFNTVVVVTGGGSGVGKVGFNPLSFTLPPGRFASSLFTYEASGATLRELVFGFRQGTGTSATTIQTVRLKNVFVTGHAVNLSGTSNLRFKVTVHYAGLQFISRTPAPGSVLTVNGWDTVRNVSDNNPNS